MVSWRSPSGTTRVSASAEWPGAGTTKCWQLAKASGWRSYGETRCCPQLPIWRGRRSPVGIPRMVVMMTEQMAFWFQSPVQRALRCSRHGCWQHLPCWRRPTRWRQNRRRFWWSAIHCRQYGLSGRSWVDLLTKSWPAKNRSTGDQRQHQRRHHGRRPRPAARAAGQA